jgi:hypothetical protein
MESEGQRQKLRGCNEGGVASPYIGVGGWWHLYQVRSHHRLLPQSRVWWDGAPTWAADPPFLGFGMPPNGLPIGVLLGVSLFLVPFLIFNLFS